jgi:hypothetical protein
MVVNYRWCFLWFLSFQACVGNDKFLVAPRRQVLYNGIITGTEIKRLIDNLRILIGTGKLNERSDLD